MRAIEGSVIGAHRPGKIERSTTSSYTAAYLIALCTLLMFGVLAFGAVEIWASSVLEIGSSVLFTVVLMHQLCVPPIRPRWNPLYPPMLGFFGLVTVQLILNLTTYRYDTLEAYVQYLAYGMLMFVVTEIAQDELSCKILVLAFTVFGSAIALFAICQSLSSTLQIYWFVPAGPDASIFGPYVNHDHYAGLMEMLAPLALTLSFSRRVYGGQRILVGFGAVIMAGSIVLSLSRGGTISLVAEISMLFWMVSKGQKGGLTRARVAFLLVALLAFLAFIGSPAMWQHLGHLQDAVRLDILKDSMRMFASKPILGWGLGTFSDAYPSVQSFYSQFFINAAHNDYLQILVETGLVGFAFVIWFIVTLYRKGSRQFDSSNETWRDILRVAALVGCTGLLVHSLFDFNLQVPANAALFYVLSALAAGLSPDSGKLTSSRPMGAYEPIG